MGFPQPSLETVPRESDLFLTLAQLSLVRHPNTLEPLSDNEMGERLPPADFQIARKAAFQLDIWSPGILFKAISIGSGRGDGRTSFPGCTLGSAISCWQGGRELPWHSFAQNRGVDVPA